MSRIMSASQGSKRGHCLTLDKRGARRGQTHRIKISRKLPCPLPKVHRRHIARHSALADCHALCYARRGGRGPAFDRSVLARFAHCGCAEACPRPSARQASPQTPACARPAVASARRWLRKGPCQWPAATSRWSVSLGSGPTDRPAARERALAGANGLRRANGGCVARG
jgi:hypothetical protein